MRKSFKYYWLAFWRRVFNRPKKYFLEPFIYLDTEDNIVCGEITSRIRWLDKLIVETFSHQEAMKYGKQMIELKYPELKRKDIWFF